MKSFCLRKICILIMLLNNDMPSQNLWSCVVKKMDPYQILPVEILLDCLDSRKYNLERIEVLNCDLNTIPMLTILIQVEDFGGSLALPHYGFNRLSADYFNNNLILHQFVIANIDDNID